MSDIGILMSFQTIPSINHDFRNHYSAVGQFYVYILSCPIRLLELQQQLSEARKRVTEIEAFSEKMKGDLADSEVKFSGERKKLETSISNLTMQRDMLQQQLKETRIDLKKRLDEVQGLQKIVSDGEVDMENLGNNVKKLQNTITRFVIFYLYILHAKL
jgi:chromosome segregation ATPase